MRFDKLGLGRRQGGSAAVEFALLVPILAIVLTQLIYICVFLYHYTVVQKAAQDSARYLSTISEQEMRSQRLAPEAAAIAHLIATKETEELLRREGAPTVEVFCGPSRQCLGVRGGALPQTIIIRVEVYLKDYFFGLHLGPWGQAVTAQVEIPYIGKQF